MSGRSEYLDLRLTFKKKKETKTCRNEREREREYGKAIFSYLKQYKKTLSDKNYSFIVFQALN